MCYVDEKGTNRTCDGWDRANDAGKQVLAAIIVIVSIVGVVSTVLFLVGLH